MASLLKLADLFFGYTLDKIIKIFMRRKSRRRLTPKRHNALPDINGVAVLRTLLEERDLRRKDLAHIFGSAKDCSDVLSGRQALTLDHVQHLSEQFYISPLVFFPRAKWY